MAEPATEGYQPLVRMQEKAAQLRQELDSISKHERHAQFKRSLTTAVGAEGALPVRRSVPRAVTMASSAGGGGEGTGGGGGAGMDRPPSASGLTSRLSSRRASNASATDVSGDEQRSGRDRSASRRVAARNSTRTTAMRDMQDNYQTAISRQNQLEEQVAELESRVRELSTDNERRQESYMRREAALQAEMAKQEDALRVARGERPNHPAFGKATTNIRELHAQVVGQIEGLLDAQASALRAEEHSTLRRFTARLGELEAAVGAERAKPTKEDGDWAEKTLALRNELDATQQIAQVLDKKHSVAAEENSRLRAQFKLQEEDREYLVRQTVALKKENGSLRSQLAAALDEVAAAAEREEAAAAAAGGGGGGGGALGLGLGSGGGAGPRGGTWGAELAEAVGGRSRPGTARGSPGAAVGGGGSSPLAVESVIQVKIGRYEEVIDSLKKLLESERKRTKQARAAHTVELQQRTGLQALLRQCVEDVRERRRALEAEGQREQQHADRATARSRPVSARSAPANASVARPLSATKLLGLPPQRRPSSAAALAFGARPASGRAPASFTSTSPTSSPAAASPMSYAASPDGGGGGGGHAEPPPLTAAEREELVEVLLGHEEVLKIVFDRSFPGVAPHPPSDPFLDRLATWQEQRDAQVAANAKVLAATKNGLLPPAMALKDATPGGTLVREAANSRWVLNVDAMMADFLGSSGGGGGGGGGGGPHSKGSAGGAPSTAGGW